MKKIKRIMSVVVLFMAASLAASASSSTSATRSFNNSICSFLKSEGYSASIDEDGDVKFKYQGYTYYIVTNERNDGKFTVACRLQFSLGSPENNNKALRLYRAANNVNFTKYWVKSYIFTTGEEEKYHVAFAVETLETNVSAYKDVLLKYIDVISDANALFDKEFQ